MLVAVGADHRGLEQKQWVCEALAALECQPVDVGTHSEDSCDYPDIAAEVAKQVVLGNAELGILLCGTGIGMSIAANKVHGIRAAVCHNEETAKLARQHNNANVLCLPANNANAEFIQQIIGAWLNSEFEGDRHSRRIDKISALESQACTAQ